MEEINIINEFVGTDWALGKKEIDGENVYLHLWGEKCEVTISCCNFIGFSFIGHWDEGIIERIWVEPKGDLITNSLREIKRLYGKPPFPSAMRPMKDQYYQLNVKLIDGNVIKVACESFEFEM